MMVQENRRRMADGGEIQIHLSVQRKENAYHFRVEYKDCFKGFALLLLFYKKIS
jgi:hypothetical protein